MTTFIRQRLRKPLGYALAGTALAVAWAVRGGPSWFLSIVIEVGALVIAITIYRGAAKTATRAHWPVPGLDDRGRGRVVVW